MTMMMIPMNATTSTNTTTARRAILPAPLMLLVLIAVQILLSTTTTTEISTTTTTATYYVSASVFMPYTTTSAVGRSISPQHQVSVAKNTIQQLRIAIRNSSSNSKHHPASSHSCSTNALLAMAIPGYGIAEQVVIGGFGNFLSIYNLIITGRILLSWFPQAAGIGALQPVYAITDPYLNLFRNIIPPIFGLDLSPILAFVVLNALTTATAAVGCELPPPSTTTGSTTTTSTTAAATTVGIGTRMMTLMRNQPQHRRRRHVD